MNRSAIGHVASALLRQIDALVRIDPQNRQETILVIEDVQSTEWASLTFVGERFVFILRIDGDPAAAAAAVAAIEQRLGDLELSVPGHFIAEIRIVPSPVAASSDLDAGGWLFRVEALVLRD